MTNAEFDLFKRMVICPRNIKAMYYWQLVDLKNKFLKELNGNSVSLAYKNAGLYGSVFLKRMVNSFPDVKLALRKKKLELINQQRTVKI